MLILGIYFCLRLIILLLLLPELLPIVLLIMLLLFWSLMVRLIRFILLMLLPRMGLRLISGVILDCIMDLVCFILVLFLDILILIGLKVYLIIWNSFLDKPLVLIMDLRLVKLWERIRYQVGNSKFMVGLMCWLMKHEHSFVQNLLRKLLKLLGCLKMMILLAQDLCLHRSRLKASIFWN